VAGTSKLDDAAALQQKGKQKEARDLYRIAADELRTSGDEQKAAAALSAAGKTSLSLGDYAGAIADAEQAIQLRRRLRTPAGSGLDYNTLGLAHQNLGNYPAALENYQQALKEDRAGGDSAGEIRELNNIGGVYSYQGRYVPALDSYQEALTKVNATADEPWTSWGRRLTVANIAILYQRLGLEERALELYQQASGKPEAMPVNEYAQLLVNQGVLYRRLGDPIKALELYRKAQAMFRSDHNAGGEIDALRSIGIVKAVDLGDAEGALEAFRAALALSQRASNVRGVIQSNLYMGETLRRRNSMSAAKMHLAVALDQAQKAGLVEEQWKALYALGQIAEKAGAGDEARSQYLKAVTIIESIRAGIRVMSLRSDFLADKQDVYDSLITLHLEQSGSKTRDVFQWMERSRARTLLDRVAAHNPLPEASLEHVQSLIPPDAVLIELWVGKQSSLALWITSQESGIVRYSSPDDLRADARSLLGDLQKPGESWKRTSRSLGDKLLAGIPLRRHVIVVPDGPLNIPFETLNIPGSSSLLIEQSDVTYLPAARYLTVHKPSRRGRSLPWTQQLVAFGDPPVSSTDALAQKEQWQALPASADEVRGIAKILPGRAEIHLGPDARKTYLLGNRLEGVPFLHFSTHALVDAENPDHSRILMASDLSSGVDYIFQEEVYDLDLKNVDLATLSACDTARGRMVRGEGIRAFSQAFLAAGASATITSQWRVADQPTAGFMKQYYYNLSRGASKSEALRAVKLEFLHSNSELSNPRYWAAFVLTGDGWSPSRQVVSWSTLLLVLAAILAVISLAAWRWSTLRSARTERRTGPPFPLHHPPESQTPQ
ncbi:MAG TPA: CHAT domain-containing tetratricopeptide repeat protein, partial [Alphaproteobacteria bacterium]|nr:CHAT domain-containing tetratricopeptide repeat protein [Alphaproteobacteria bacterium]